MLQLPLSAIKASTFLNAFVIITTIILFTSPFTVISTDAVALSPLLFHVKDQGPKGETRLALLTVNTFSRLLPESTAS